MTEPTSQVSVHVKKYAEGRLNMWSSCAPEHAAAFEVILKASMNVVPEIMTDRYFSMLAKYGIPREAGEAFLAGLRYEDVVILRDPGT